MKKPYKNKGLESYDPIHVEVDSPAVREFKKRKHIGSNRIPKKKKRK